VGLWRATNDDVLRQQRGAGQAALVRQFTLDVDEDHTYFQAKAEMGNYTNLTATIMKAAAYE
jgi:hypothetical protein